MGQKTLFALVIVVESSLSRFLVFNTSERTLVDDWWDNSVALDSDVKSTTSSEGSTIFLEQC